MENSFLEMSRSTIFINRLEESSISWCNSHLAARTDKGIHLFEFSKNLVCLEKKIDFTETFIKTPTSSPCSQLLLNKLNKLRLKNKDMSEMILDTAFWPHSEYLVNEMSSVVAFEWSPRGLLQNNECILAIVNNIGSVELYVNGRIIWRNVLDLYNLVRDQLSDDILEENPTSFENLKQAVFNLESCSVCWSPILKNGASILVTGQKSGTLLFWMLKSAHENITAKCCGKINIDFGETVTVVWIPKSDTHFVLICTNSNGQIAAFECHFDKEVVVLSNAYMIWEHEDRMLVQHIQYEVIDNHRLLVFHKHRHLIMQLVDENFKTVSQVIKNINDYRITCIVKSNTHFYVSTVNFKLYRIKYNIKNNVLNVDFELIKLKDISETCELYNVCFSDNNVICALSMIDRKILHKKERLKLQIIFLQVLPDNAELEILLNNPTKQITNYWDCIELLRYKIVKTKTLPPKDYDVLLPVQNTNVYVLKIYLIILTVYKNLLNSAKIERTSLPENSIEVIKDKILAEHAKSNIVKIYDEQCNRNPLSELEKECFMGSKKYLELHSRKYNIPLKEMITPHMLDLTFEKHTYSCGNCDEEIIDFSCRNEHLNMFCMLTFTPIESIDYLSCKKCGTIARFELKNCNPMCIFCDSYINDSHLLM